MATQRTRSVALFGQADYKLTEKLTVTAGLRWSNDRIRMDYNSLFDVIGGVAPVKAYSDVTLPLLDFKGTKTFRDLSWRAALVSESREKRGWAPSGAVEGL